jgi:hypothetical protein
LSPGETIDFGKRRISRAKSKIDGDTGAILEPGYRTDIVLSNGLEIAIKTYYASMEIDPSMKIVQCAELTKPS